MTEGVRWANIAVWGPYAAEEMANEYNEDSTWQPWPAINALEGMLLSLAIKDLNRISDLEGLGRR
jgi:hypothetical protein